MRNDRGSIGFKNLVFFILLIYLAFAGYKMINTHFTKSRIKEDALNVINSIKAPSVYSDEKAITELKKVLKQNGVFDEKFNAVDAFRTEDRVYVNYTFKYRIRTDLLFFKTKWETVVINEKSDTRKRM